MKVDNNLLICNLKSLLSKKYTMRILLSLPNVIASKAGIQMAPIEYGTELSLIGFDRQYCLKRLPTIKENKRQTTK